MIDFKIKERGTSAGTEVLAGVTTYFALVYIVVVNPSILAQAGLDFNGVFIATIIASVLGTLIMGLFANLPLAVAPAMGTNAFFVFGIVLAGRHSVSAALAAVVAAGVIFSLLSATRFRYYLIDSIPPAIKHGIAAGIGLMVAFIGLSKAQIIVSSPATLLMMGKLNTAMPFIALCGVFATVFMIIRKIPGAIFLGMLFTALISWLGGYIWMPQALFAAPSGLAKTAFLCDWQSLLNPEMIVTAFVLLLITLFDTTGTMLGIGEQAGLIKKGKLENAGSAFMADSLATTVGGLLGTSPTTAYVESGAGVAVGGKTGLTAVVTGILLFLTLFFAPLASMLAGYGAITAPALIVVGFLMMSGIGKIEWGNFSESFPAFVVVGTIPLSLNIATGVGMGIIAYAMIRLFTGRFMAMNGLMKFFFAVFLVYFGFFMVQ